MGSAASADPDLVAVALNRYLAARTRSRRGLPGAADDVALARADLVHLLRLAGWEPPPSVAATLDEAGHDQEHDQLRHPRAEPLRPVRAPHRRTA